MLPLPAPLSDDGVLYDPYFGIALIHIIFQTGFFTFVLSNYMKTISKELTEAALVDGASLWMIYRKVILPLCRPALAAMAALEFTFIYNDFFWALLLMTAGDKRPITSALNNLQGAFFTDKNQLAAASLHRGPADDHRVPRAVQAVRPRADAGLDEGLVRRQGARAARAASVSGQTASRTNSQARKSPHQAAARAIGAERQPDPHQLVAATQAGVGRDRAHRRRRPASPSPDRPPPDRARAGAGDRPPARAG